MYQARFAEMDGIQQCDKGSSRVGESTRREGEWVEQGDCVEKARKAKWRDGAVKMRPDEDAWARPPSKVSPQRRSQAKPRAQHPPASAPGRTLPQTAGQKRRARLRRA